MKFVYFHHFKKISDTTPKPFRRIDRCLSTYEHTHTPNTYQIHIKGSDNDSHTIDFVWTINSACLGLVGLFERHKIELVRCLCVSMSPQGNFTMAYFLCAACVWVSEWAGARFVLLRFIGFWRTHNAQKDNDNNNFMNWNNNDFYGHCFISLFLCCPSIWLYIQLHIHPVIHFAVHCWADPQISFWRDFSMICQFVPTLLFYLHLVWHLFRLIIS